MREFRLALCPLLILLGPPAAADDGLPTELREEAWFTGSLNSTGATALPAGHFLAEPYLTDVIVRPTGGPASHSGDSMNLLMYGVTDDVTLGLIPRFALREGARPGDVTARLQYRLTAYDEASGMPSLAVLVNETFPAGRHDRLNRDASDAGGSGAYVTQPGFLVDDYATLPGGHALRMRLNLYYSWSTAAGIEGRSVYGTPAGFLGHADPGARIDATAAFEASLTTRWALALDLAYERADGTAVAGAGFRGDSGRAQSFSPAPAVEYNWSPFTGLIVGVQLPAWQRNAPVVIMPMAALNCVF